MKEGYKSSALGEIPVEWEVDSIDNIFDFLRTKSLSRAQLNYEAGEVNYVHYGDIHSTFKFPIVDANITKLPLVNEDVELNGDLQYLKEGDLIIADASEDLDGVGKCIEIIGIDNKKVIGGLHTIVLRDKLNKTSIGIKPYLLHSPLVIKSLKRIATGASVLGISKSNLNKLNLPLPPLPEQQKIASILSTADQKIEVIDQQITETQELKKGLMQRLLTKGIGHTKFKDSALGEIPESWEVVKLGEVSKSFVGIASSATHAYVNNGILLIRNQNIKEGKLNLDDTLFITADYEIQHKSKRLKADDILTVRTGYPGISAVVPKELEGSQSFTTLITRRTKEKYTSKYLCYFINSEIGKTFFNGAQAGGGQKNVGSKTLETMPTLLPPLPEQHKIASILSTVDEKIEVLQDKKAEYQELKKGLMQQLLTGKTRVKLN